MYQTRLKILLGLLTLALLLAGCGRLEIQPEIPNQTSRQVSADTRENPSTKGDEEATADEVVGQDAPDETEAQPDAQDGSASVSEQQSQEALEPDPNWVIAEDPRTGIRFAVPCFWMVDITYTEYEGETVLTTLFVANYDKEFNAQFGRGDDFWGTGAIKLDIGYVQPSTWNLGAETDMLEVIRTMRGSEAGDILDHREVAINGQPALLVVTEGLGSRSGQAYYFRLADDLLLSFSAFTEALETPINHPDVQGILDSISLDPSIEVELPTFRPADPPVGYPAACLDGVAEE